MTIIARPIAMWSGPRNISTAMMYAFAGRADCVAWDEPFYGAYLKETGLHHPMRTEILAACQTDWRKVASACTAPAAKPVFYQKHMTHHMLPQFDRSFIRTLTNAFLIRKPEKVLASYAKSMMKFHSTPLALWNRRRFLMRWQTALVMPRPWWTPMCIWKTRAKACNTYALRWALRLGKPCCNGPREQKPAMAHGPRIGMQRPGPQLVLKNLRPRLWHFHQPINELPIRQGRSMSACANTLFAPDGKTQTHHTSHQHRQSHPAHPRPVAQPLA